MNWLEIAVTVLSEGEEAVTDLFYRLGCQGVVVEAPELIQEYINSGAWDYHDFEDLELTGKCVVKGYFPEDERLAERLVSLREEIMYLQGLFPEWMIETKSLLVSEQDWANEWKRYFKPIMVGKRFLVKPSWEKVTPQEGVTVIEIDPGMAFGTGTHATTVLCLEAIEDCVTEETRVFDIGTGSGILAVAAAKLGAEVQACDIDPMAVKITRQNAVLNGVADKIQVKTGNLGDVFYGQADVVLANIIADVIIELLPQLNKLLKPDGLFLASGIIDSRVDDVVKKVKEAGFRCVGQNSNSGWCLLKIRR